MKHKQKCILKNLTLDQFNEKFTTLSSICISHGILNSMIMKFQHDNFLKSNIYREICDATCNLNIFNNITIYARIAVLNNKATIENCTQCNKPFLYVKSEQKTYKLCNHKQRYSTLSKQKLNESKTEKHIAFVNSLNNTTLFLTEDDFNKYLNIYSQKHLHYAYICTKDPEFFHDLIIKTANAIKIDVNDLHIGHRIYCACHNIYSKDDFPKCIYCGKPTYIKNRKEGFAKSCLDCSQLLSNDTRSKRNKNIVDSIIDKTKYEIIRYPKTFSHDFVEIRCKKCGFISKHKFTCGAYSRFRDIPLCMNCERKGASIEQHEVYQYICSIVDSHVIQCDRTQIYPKELDIFVPDLNKAIEYNGLFWHSYVKGDTNKYRHRNKVLMCQKKNIQTFTMFSDVWMFNNDVSKKALQKFMLFGKTQSIKTINIKQICYSDAEKFHNSENIFGSIKSSINYGAFENNNLIAVISFRESIFNKHIQYELTRFSYVVGINEIKTFKDMLYAFEHDNIKSLKSIIWYCKLESPIERFFAQNEGFIHVRDLKPDYMYVQPSCTQRLDKHYFSKDKQKYVLDLFDSNKSEIDNMENNGYRRVFDCGKEVWIRRY